MNCMQRIDRYDLPLIELISSCINPRPAGVETPNVETRAFGVSCVESPQHSDDSHDSHDHSHDDSHQPPEGRRWGCESAAEIGGSIAS